MPEPSIGRIVHYVLDEGPSKGEARPAQIVAVFPQPDGPPLLNLIATLDGTNDRIEDPLAVHVHQRFHRADGTITMAPTMPVAVPALHVWRTSIPHATAVGSPPTFVPGTWHWPSGVN